MKSLKEKTVSGVKWQVAGNAVQKVVSIGTFAVLARILEPSAFGLFAMAFIVIDGFHTLKSFGFDSALIQRNHDVEAAKHTSFSVILISGMIMFLLCYAVAPWASYFFKSPELTSVLRALALIFVINGCARIPLTLLQKKMSFRAISVIELIGAGVNGLIAVGLALATASVWSLVWAYVIKQAVMCVLSFLFSGYRAAFVFDRKVARELFDFGKFVFGLKCLRYLSTNVSNVAVGRMLGAAQLGYFALATNAGMLINTHFTTLILEVMFPAFSAIQDDRESLKRAYLKTIKFISILSIPFSIALICLAEEFVLTLYGPKWLDIVPLIKLYGLIQLMDPVARCSEQVFTGCGKSDYVFRLTCLSVFVKIPLLFVFTKWWGLMGVMGSILIATAVVDPLSVILVQKVIAFSWREFFEGLAPSFVCSLVMLAILLTFKNVLFPGGSSFAVHSFLRLGVLSAAGMFSYVMTFFFLDRASTMEVKRMIFNLERV